MSVTESIARRSISSRLTTDDASYAAEALADGMIVGHGFANFYAITTRADEHTVRRVNVMKGRPPRQVGSVTGPPSAIPDAWDLSALPDGLTRRSVLQLLDVFFSLGPFGFRGPAADHIPEHLTLADGAISTAQVIAPGYACPSNDLLARSLSRTGDDLLYITSANRSRHVAGADDSRAHWLAAGLRAEFENQADFLIVEHPDEDAVRARYPAHAPMSTSVLGLHRVVRVDGDRRPHLILERHGSLPVEHVRAVLDGLGYGLALGPRATTRLLQRDYSLGLTG